MLHLIFIYMEILADYVDHKKDESIGVFWNKVAKCYKDDTDQRKQDITIAMVDLILRELDMNPAEMEQIDFKYVNACIQNLANKTKEAYEAARPATAD